MQTLKSEPSAKRASAGRPRSEAARHAILNATFESLSETNLRDLTIEAIAAAAGVGKATIYRWWPSKAALIVDAVTDRHLIRTPMPRTGTASAALTSHIALLIDYYSGEAGRIVAQILAEGQSDPDALREFRERFFYGRRATVREVIEKGRSTSEFAEGVDPELAIDFIYAPIYLRLIFKHLPLDKGFAKELAKLAVSTLKQGPK
jgi:AcrR family transcriptional regulator